MRDQVKNEILECYGKEIGQTIITVFEMLKIENCGFFNKKILFPYSEPMVGHLMAALTLPGNVFTLGIEVDNVLIGVPEQFLPPHKLVRSRKGFFLSKKEKVTFVPFVTVIEDETKNTDPSKAKTPPIERTSTSPKIIF